MDAGPSMVDVDSSGKYIVFNNYPSAAEYQKDLYCLDGKNGRLLWAWDFQPVFPEKDLRIRHGVDISDDGQFVVALSQDGWGFFLDNLKMIQTHGKEGLIWEKNISTPIEVNKIIISGFGSTARGCGKQVIFSMGNT